MTDRRNILKMGIAATTLGLSGFQVACQSQTANQRRKLDFTKPEDNLYGFIRLFGDISGQRTFNYQPGRIYAHRDGELPRHMLNYAGVTLVEVRPSATEDAYEVRLTGSMLMKDPITDEIIDTWEDPWTGEQREVEHFSTQTVGKRTYGLMGQERSSNFDAQSSKYDKPFILPWQVIGGLAWAPVDTFWIYTDAKGNPRYENAIHTYHGRIADIENTALTNVPATIASQSQSPFFPWMGGLSQKGHMILTSFGRKMEKIDLIPEVILEGIEKRFPGRLDSDFGWD